MGMRREPSPSQPPLEGEEPARRDPGRCTARASHRSEALTDSELLSPGRADGAGAPAVLRHAAAGGDRLQLLRLRRHQHGARVRVGQLRGAVRLEGHAVAVLQDHLFRGDRVGDHAGRGLHGRLFPRVPRAQHALADGAVPAVHGAVLDLEHHPHDLVDPVPRPQRHLQPGADGGGRHQRAAGVPAVLRLRGHRRLRAPVHAVHDRADLQLDGAHRSRHHRGRAWTQAAAVRASCGTS